MDRRCVIWMLSFTFIAPAFCAAQQGTDVGQTSAGSNKGQMLVLVDGQIVTGRFTPRPDGYDVQVPSGRMFIEASRVRFVARSMDDAYKRMRLSQTALTPESHMELARWCVTNKLPDYARREVLDALHLDPNRADAKRLLESLVRSQNPAALPDASMNSGLTQYPSLRNSGGPIVETRSLAGLSRTVAQEFTRHVQPLLMNKCANAGCHGPGTTSSFQLASSRQGSNPTIAERNLAAVLKQIDLSRPTSSPLIANMEGAHGGSKIPLFRGRSGAQQMGVLREWVEAVAMDIDPNASPEARAAADVVQPASAVRNANRTPAVQADMLGSSAIPHGRKLSSDETDKTFLSEAVRANAYDEFDPSVFNQQFHGTSDASGRGNSKLPRVAKSNEPESEVNP